MQIERLGPYLIERKIGKGGMGAVYQAVLQGAGGDQRVAVKALNPQLAQAEGFRERFEAEIDSLKMLRHDGIVRLLGYGEQDGILFYSMELVEGSSLEELIHASRKFDWRETLGIGIQVCRALKHAHDHGVVHRDIKPANLMLTAEGKIKIADFGIARLFGGTQLTTAGGVLGTADYMSPEQADGRPVTDKCDQYGLGGVMYALLAGRPPFKASTMPEMLQLQRFAEPESVGRYARDTPPQLDRLVMQLLSKDPEKRFPNVMVLGRHMEAMEKALSRPGRNPATAEPKLDSADKPYTAKTVEGQHEITHTPGRSLYMPTEETPDAKSLELYDAPTIDQSTEAESSSVPPQEITLAESAVESAPRPAVARFTTVDEETRRKRESERGSSLAWLGQIGLPLVALGLLVAGGWYVMRPSTADQLLDAIQRRLEEEGVDDLRIVKSEMEEFGERFPDDPRNRQLDAYREQLEYQNVVRQARRRARNAGEEDLQPIERLYTQAMEQAKTDPAAALATLQATLALYDPEGATAGGNTDLTEGPYGDPRLLVAAREQIVKLSEAAKREAAAMEKLLEERLTAARQMEFSNRAQAVAMYQAIVKLYGNQTAVTPWITQAQSRLEELTQIEPH